MRKQAYQAHGKKKKLGMHFEISYPFSVPVCWLWMISTMLFKPISARHLHSLFASLRSAAHKPHGKSMPSRIQYMWSIQWKLGVRGELAMSKMLTHSYGRSCKKKKKCGASSPRSKPNPCFGKYTPHTHATHFTHCHHTCIDEGHKRDRSFALHFSRSLTLLRLLQNQN